MMSTKYIAYFWGDSFVGIYNLHVFVFDPPQRLHGYRLSTQTILVGISCASYHPNPNPGWVGVDSLRLCIIASVLDYAWTNRVWSGLYSFIVSFWTNN